MLRADARRMEQSASHGRLGRVAMLRASGMTAMADRKTAPTVSRCRTEWITDHSTFLALEPAWDALVAEAGIDHPFLTHAWLRVWWDCFGMGKELRIVVVRRGAEILAIAPLMFDQARLYGVTVRQLSSITNDHTPRFNFIVAGRADEAHAEIWKQLATHQNRWDVLKLCQLPADSQTLTDLQELAAEDEFLAGIWRAEDSPYARLEGSWDRYNMSLTCNHRSQMRKRLRRLSGLGSVDVETIASPAGLEVALEDGLRIEAAAWKARAGTAILCQPSLTRFYTDLARTSATQGLLRLWFLRVDGRRIAFAYGLCFANKLYALKVGYDLAYASYSPYNLLCSMVLKEACERGVTEYDFVGGSEDWKLRWTYNTRAHFWLYVFPQTLRGRLLHWAKFRVAPRFRAAQ
jgi:CelD/BcsL family acetyltransferase involved in cellulose biosynthesis